MRFLAGGSAHLEKTGEDQSSSVSEILISSKEGWQIDFILSTDSNGSVVAARHPVPTQWEKCHSLW